MSSIFLTFTLGAQQCYVSNGAKFPILLLELLVRLLICFNNWTIGFWCVRNEGLHSSAASGTFLVDDGPYYFCVLEILLGRLSKSLYNQVLIYDIRNA